MPLLVLMPGMDGTGKLFAPLLEVIPASFRHIVISYPPDELLSYDQLLRLIEERLNEEKEMILIAESFSGPLAIWFAASHPDKVRALILCASFIKSPVRSWLRHILTWPVIFRLPIPSAVIRRFLLGSQAPDALVRRCIAAVGMVRPEVMANRMREVIQLDCSDAFAGCRLPILYLAASEDAIIRKSKIAPLCRIHPEMLVKTVNGPHLLLQAQPAAAWREIESFLDTQNEAPL